MSTVAPPSLSPPPLSPETDAGPAAAPDPRTVAAPVPGAPLISAVVPVYNGAAHLDACLRSILDQIGAQHGTQPETQQSRFRLELIVVDDGSTDDSAAIARALIPVAADRGIPLRVLPQPNGGPSVARNRGVAAAVGDWIAFLDADDLWPPDRLAVQLAVLDADAVAHPDDPLGLLFGDCQVFTTDGVVLVSYFADAGLVSETGAQMGSGTGGGIGVGIGTGFFGHPWRVIDAYEKLFRCNYVPTGAVLVRRDCLLRAGGFDPDLRLVEDLDLWLRIARQCGVGYTSALCQRKRQHAGGLSADPAAMTRAYIGVIERHWQTHRADLRRRGVRPARRLALEYSLLGDAAEAAGDARAARGCYLRALATAPGPRPLYYWLRCLLRRPRT